MDDLVLQTRMHHLTSVVEAVVEDDLPAPLQAKLKALGQLSDEALWAIAQSTLNPDKLALYDTLLERLHEQPLTSEGREWLTRLREEANALMLRKAHAYTLLQGRRHSLSSLNELRAETT